MEEKLLDKYVHVRACVRTCVRACVRVYIIIDKGKFFYSAVSSPWGILSAIHFTSW